MRLCFSVNKNMLQPNQKELSLVNRRLIYDHMKAKQIDPATYKPNDDLRKAVRGARTKQRNELKARKKDEQKSELTKNREKIDQDIKTTKSAKEDLNNLCSQLQKDYEDLMSKAASDKSSAHVLAVKADSLKRTRDDKIKEIEKLEGVIEDLGKRRKMMEEKKK